MKNVLLVDDEQRMLDLLSLYLTPNGYYCIKKNSGMEALAYLEKEKADVVLLDIMMPEMDGWTTCQKIRELSDVPIIMLTARNAKEEIVKGLKMGADDYVSKPFNEAELLARIEAVTRRTKDNTEELLHFKGLTVDKNAFEVFYKGQKLLMTPKEISLLSLFLQYPNKVFSRDHLLSTIWGFDAETEDRTIDSHIRNLRDKLRKVGFPINQHLKTVWGVGYKWSPTVE
ncbi:response regulator transcription factor [Margalitia sp. FSL K6-0131]|uniref:response regulator transcription factor n=1 Tax=Margalitia sp. FSL K6-0131 TaxID=2954604 RepID=UPI0030F84DFB